MIRALLAALCLAGPARADGTPGEFDYYVLSLSWSPTWCALEGDAEDAQCQRGMAWVVHGLWPQHEEGYPVDCDSRFPGPTERDAERMADLMGSAGLARHEWRRHGTCSGMSPRDYFREVRRAWEGAEVPDAFVRLPGPVEIEAAVVEDAFLREDSTKVADGVTVTCQDGYVDEVRLCLTRDLEPRACGADVARDCRGAALMEPPG